MNPLTIPLKPSSSVSNLQLPSLFASRPSKQIRIKKSNLLGTLTYQQKLKQRLPLMTVQEYQQWTSQQINSEYHELKQQLRKISDKINRLIDFKQANLQKKKNISNVKSFAISLLENSQVNKLGLNSSSSVNTFQKNPNNIYEGYEKNNSKIFLNNQHELQKLIKREQFILQSQNPYGLKQELKQKIQQIKLQIKQEKKNYKELTLQSEKVGNEIINTDKLIEEIRILQKELNVLVLRKTKLETQVQQNQKNQQLIEQGTVNIAQKQYELICYENQKKNSIEKIKSQQELKNIMLKKERTIAALKRDKEAKDKISAKKYYELLTQLNEIQKLSQAYTNKYDILEAKIELTNHDYEDYKIIYDEIMAKVKLQKSKSKTLKTSSSGHNSFLTELQNIKHDQDLKKSTFYKSKQNLQQNRISQKELIKQIEENLQKTQKNLDSMQKMIPQKHPQVQYQIDTLINQQEEKQNVQEIVQQAMQKMEEKKPNSHGKKYSDSKKYKQFQDSQILEQPQQFEHSNGVQQLQQRFRQNTVVNQQKMSSVQRIRG